MAASSRQIFGVLSDSTNNINAFRDVKTAGTSGVQVSMFMDELQAQLHKRLEIIKGEMINGKQEQQELHATGILKIARSIRMMPVKEFNEKFNCDLLSLLSVARSNVENKGVPFTSKKRDRLQVETPTVTRTNDHYPTPFRTIRRGEVMYSRNGSPVEPVEGGSLVATVNKKRRGNSSAAANFDINVGEGKYISLNDPNGIQGLDDTMKKVAISQLQVLQTQMTSIIEQLQN